MLSIKRLSVLFYNQDVITSRTNSSNLNKTFCFAVIDGRRGAPLPIPCPPRTIAGFVRVRQELVQMHVAIPTVEEISRHVQCGVPEIVPGYLYIFQLQSIRSYSYSVPLVYLR